jgi:hypothetical protein
MHTLHALARSAAGRLLTLAPCLLVLAVVQLSLPDVASGQPQRGGQAVAPQAPDLKPTGERVRVPTSHANIQAAPSSGAQILVLAPRGTVLDVLGRDKEWVRVQLIPELRKTGIVMRWYRNETSGWMHDSTVEVVK